MTRIFKWLPAALIAVLTMRFAASAETRVWQGTAGRWVDAGNWSGAAIPADGDDVYITNAGASVILDVPSSNLNSVTINKTLTFTNWTTKLAATNVLIRNGATVTIPATYTNGQMSNRVWIVCSNLFLEVGATIQASGRGYAGGVWMCPGSGPGGGGGNGNGRGGGGGHGGRGGMGEGNVGGVEYDFTNAPMLPGSGGGMGNAGAAGHGGGAVFIDAAGGAVTINGTINANGTDGNAQQAGGGSGGSIYINCATFAGTNGLLTASGGSCAYANPLSGGGSGGRIAVACASVVQPLAIAYNAAAGSGMYSRTNTYWVNRGAVHGTVCLSDTALIAEAPPGLSGYIILPTSTVALPGNLTQTNGVLGIPEGATWTVAGNLTIKGPAAQLHVSGSSSGTNTDAGAVQVTILRCGGDLELTNGGILHVWAGVTNGVASAECGTLVAVTGALRLVNGAWIYPYSNPTNGGSVRFEANQVAIDAGSGINADYRGYRSSNGRFDLPKLGEGYGPGAGGAGARGGGAGYGGKGGDSSAPGYGGVAYGSTNVPILAGSGGGCYGDYPPAGNGGGVIWIQAADRVLMDGVLTARGQNGPMYDSGGGSGGSILIDCGSFRGGSQAVLRVTGGSSPDLSGHQGGGGGGGRIAMWIGLSAAERTDLLNGVWPVSGIYSYADIVPGFGGVWSVTNGVGKYAAPDARAAYPGTLVAIVTNPALFTVMIEGDPARHGAPAPQGYWLDIYAPGTFVTNSVATPADESNGLRRACTGWRLDVAGSTNVTSGTTFQTGFDVTTNLVLTWRWTNEWKLMVSSNANGTVNGGAVNGWYTNGTQVGGIAAVADPGYVFSQWASADVPEGMATRNPLTVTMDRSRTNIVALFTPSIGQTKIWAGTGNWTNSGNWSPPGMPGITDQTIIQSGTCTIADPRVADSCVVSNGATLFFTNWMASLNSRNDAVVRSTAVLTLPAAYTNNQMSNRVHVICKNFTLDAGAAIQVAGRGYKGGDGMDKPGSGPGGGPVANSRGGGGGHGGKGGNGESCAGGAAYDSTNKPVLPGSGAGTGNGSSVSGAGGGAVRIDASLAVVIEGTINANGTDGTVVQSGGGSGGSIFITCYNFSGTSGVMTAAGGSCIAGGPLSGGGGGGRIAVWYGGVPADRAAGIADGSNMRHVIVTNNHAYFTGALSVTNGSGIYNGPPNGAEPGSIVFLTVTRLGSVMIMR